MVIIVATCKWPQICTSVLGMYIRSYVFWYCIGKNYCVITWVFPISVFDVIRIILGSFNVYARPSLAIIIDKCASNQWVVASPSGRSWWRHVAVGVVGSILWRVHTCTSSHSQLRTSEIIDYITGCIRKFLAHQTVSDACYGWHAFEHIHVSIRIFQSVFSSVPNMGVPRGHLWSPTYFDNYYECSWRNDANFRSFAIINSISSINKAVSMNHSRMLDSRKLDGSWPVPPGVRHS